MKIMKKKKKKAGVAHEEQKKKRHSKQKCMKKHKKAVSRQALQQNEARKKKQMQKDKDRQKYIKRQMHTNPTWKPRKGIKECEFYQESKKNAGESKNVNAEESKKPKKKDLVTAQESKVNAEERMQLLMRQGACEMRQDDQEKELSDQKKKLDSTDTVARKADACSQSNTSTIEKLTHEVGDLKKVAHAAAEANTQKFQASSRECFRRLGSEVEKLKREAKHNKERLDAQDARTGHSTPKRRTRGYYGR